MTDSLEAKAREMLFKYGIMIVGQESPLLDGLSELLREAEKGGIEKAAAVCWDYRNSSQGTGQFIAVHLHDKIRALIKDPTP